MKVADLAEALEPVLENRAVVVGVNCLSLQINRQQLLHRLVAEHVQKGGVGQHHPPGRSGPVNADGRIFEQVAVCPLALPKLLGDADALGNVIERGKGKQDLAIRSIQRCRGDIQPDGAVRPADLDVADPDAFAPQRSHDGQPLVRIGVGRSGDEDLEHLGHLLGADGVVNVPPQNLASGTVGVRGRAVSSEREHAHRNLFEKLKQPIFARGKGKDETARLRQWTSRVVDGNHRSRNSRTSGILLAGT